MRITTVSASVQSETRITEGTTGTLRLSFSGVDYVDDVRVVRCQAPVAGDGWYRIGAQFLWTSHPGERSLRRVIAAMQGLPVQWPSLELPAAEGWRSPVGRRQYAPVRIVDGAVLPAHRLGSGSHLVASLHLADGLAVVPQEVERVEPGYVVRVHRTDGAWGGTPGT